MWDLIPFKTSIVPVQPFYVLKENPTSYYDRFPLQPNGRELFVQDVLKYSRLNATILESDTMGQCLWVNNTNVCTGIMRMIMENEIDAGLLPLNLVSYQTENLFPDLKFGPFLSDSKRVFLSTPQ